MIWLLKNISFTSYFHYVLRWASPNCDAEEGRWARTTERPLLPPGGLPVTETARIQDDSRDRGRTNDPSNLAKLYQIIL